jgi:hypothetical protein
MRAWTLMLLIACGGSKDGEDSSAVAASGTCADPATNPYAGSCVETYLAGCFDPSGPCEGQVSLTGEVDLTWSNGASVNSELEGLGVSTTVTSSSGATCATATMAIMAGSCASETVYVREGDGATLGFCSGLDGSLTVTCPDGSSFAISAIEAASGQACQFATGDAEACSMDLPSF